MTKPYFPNNWRELRDAPSEYFDDIAYDEFMEWKITGWEIPSSVTCIIRETTPIGKIKEHTYQKASAAQKKIDSLFDRKAEFIVCDQEQVHYFHPKLDGNTSDTD